MCGPTVDEDIEKPRAERYGGRKYNAVTRAEWIGGRSKCAFSREGDMRAAGRTGTGHVRSAAILPVRIPDEAKDGSLTLKLAIPVSKRLVKRRHDLVFLASDGRMVGLPRTWRPGRTNDRFGPAARTTGPVPCTTCGRAAVLDPRAHGQIMAFRCFYCLRVYCFGCAKAHFGVPRKYHTKAFGRKVEIIFRKQVT